MFFIGRILPASDPKLPNKELSPNDFNVDNARDLKLAGHPMYDEHDWTTDPKGRILYSFTNDDGTKFVLGKITDRKLQTEVRKGDKRELSFTHHWSVNINPNGTEIQTRIPLEVSVTKKGNRPNCLIIYFFDKQIFPNSFSKANTKSMATQHTEPQTQDPTPTPQTQAQSPTQEQSLDYDTMDPSQVIELLKAEGMTGDEAFVQLVEMKKQLGQLSSQVGQLSDQNKDSEAARMIQEAAAVEAYEADLVSQGVQVTENMHKMFMDMIHTKPQQMQMVMTNNKVQAQQHLEMKRQLQSYREQEQRKREKRGARNWLNSSTSHRVGQASSGPSGMFKNSAYDRVSTPAGTPALQIPFVSEAQQPYAQGMSNDEFAATLNG